MRKPADGRIVIYSQKDSNYNNGKDDNTNAINKSKGNLNIVIHDIKMENIDAFPREIITLCDSQGMFKGSVGNILPILEIMDEDLRYKENVATNATLVLAKAVNNNIITSKNSKVLELNIGLT